MTIAPNTSIADYTIVSKIGEGGMGEVWRAHDAKLSRDVAIKVLPAAFSSDPERLKRFEQEAQAAGALNHPNILVIYHIGTHEGSPYIVSELLEGETLRERMGGVALPQRKAIDYSLQLAHGLAAAHEKGIVHRDLKPENIFITKDGRVKILDFGLAKLLGAGDSYQSQTEVPTRRVDTDPGVVMGTIGYMSPEQLRGRPADHRSDIFSFGAILYEMLSGKRAFRGESTADTMSAILREDPSDLSSSNRNIAPALERVVNHCLEKNPEERFHSASDLGFAIEALSGSGRMSDSTETVLHAIPAGQKNRRELIAWLVAAVALIGLVLLATLYLRRPEETEKQMRFVVALPEKVSEVAFPIISPDGNSIAFLGTSEGRRMLFVREINSLTAKPLNGTEDSSFPFWSPDGRQLAFFSHGKIAKIDINGGTPQALCDAQSGGGGSWNRNGVILFAVDNRPLQRVSASAGGVSSTVIPLDQSRKETAHFWPHFLPDGEHFLYQSWTGRAEESAIYVASLDGKDRKLLVKTDSNAAYATPGYLLFARATTLLAQPFNLRSLELSGEPVTVADQVTFTENYSLSNFSVSDTGVLVFWGGSVVNRQLIWFDRSGKQLDLVGPPGEYNDLVLSPDEKRLAVQRIDGNNSDLWMFDLARNLPSRFTFETSGEDDPVWSPDGNTLVFSVSNEGPFDLYKRLSSGTGKQELVSKTPESKEGSDWSPDGKFILLDVYSEKSGLDIWVLPLFGDGKPYALLNSRFQEGQGHFSPDGKWVAYTSNESGRNEVYVRRFPECDNQMQISTDGGAQPHWRKDGREFFYIASDRKLMAVDVTLGTSLQVGTPKPLFTTRIMRYEAPNRYVVSGDGQKFLVNSAVEESNPTPITVVLNWASGLKK
ncbi:MAG TPA: protein kinase [Pyrinomonadaceae bacterium]|jgi:Tol biopolymer transport system component|nr:protein kinase [Pyrinomonadaceae bacterium]